MNNKRKFFVPSVLLMFCLLVTACSTPTSDAPTLVSVQADFQNVKEEYELNELLDISNAYLVFQYSDGKHDKKVVTPEMVSGFDSSRPGKSVLKISYDIYEFFLPVKIKNTVEVDIYMTVGTLPTLFSGLNVLKSTNDSYFFYTRTGTFNDNKMPDNVKKVWSADTAESLREVRKTVIRLANENPDMKFNLYCDDIRLQWEIQTFVENGIYEDRYNVYLISDGTRTYINCLELIYGDDGTYPLWQTNAEKYTSAKQYAREGKATGLTEDSTNPIELETAVVKAAQANNFEYWLQFPEFYKSQDTAVQQEIQKAHLVKKEPNVMFEQLTDAQKTQFYELVNLEKSYFDKLFQQSDKPDIIISGGSYNASGNFTGYIEWVAATYGDTYDLFFKPHPAYPPQSGAVVDLDLLERMSITILPGRLPMEALLWVYPDIKIGGYNSSLYMSAKDTQVLFFLNISDGSKLSSPLNSLYAKGLFHDAQFVVK